MARQRTQLSIQLPPELLARLRSEAATRGSTITSLVARWIQAGLPGTQDGDSRPASTDPAVLARLDALELAVAAINRPALSSPDRVIPAPLAAGSSQEGETAPQGAAEQQASALPVDQQPPAGAITTAELASRTGTNRAAWNNWAAKAQVGDVREHSQAGRWRLAGRAAAAGGGPPRWLWEPA